MTQMVRILAGLICFCFLVARPIQANLLASVAIHYKLSLQDKTILFSSASEIDPCEPNIMRALGDTYVSLNNQIMAAVSYGNAMLCSPGDSWVRFEFGELLFSLGFDGIDHIKDALRLEPNNPIYQSEYNRIMAHLSQ